MKLEALIAEFNNSAKLDLAFYGEVDLTVLSEKRREVQEAKRILARLSVLLSDVHAEYTLGLAKRLNRD